MAYQYRGDPYERGPSPWVPVTILGVILLIVTAPYRSAPDVAAVGYPGAAIRPAATGLGIPPALIWIPIICYVVTQFLGTGSPRAAAYYRNERFPFRNAGMAYGNGEYYPGGAYDDNQRYNGPHNRTYSSTFMDYGGHWLLIILGLWLFSLVTSPGPVAVGGRRVGFPWSMFAPPPQIVLPVL